MLKVKKMPEILDVKKSVERELLSIPGVVGVGVGRSNIDTIHIYAEKYIYQLPKEIGGYPVQLIITDRIRPLSLIQIPYVELLSPLDVDRKAKWRPAPGGVSIGHHLITTGTLGSRVYDAYSRERLILSNCHVLAAADSDQTPRANVGDPILQPGPYDGGVVETDQIASLLRWVKLKEGKANVVDCALARPLADEDLLDEILNVGSVTTWTDPITGMPVKKSGRTTSLETGIIMDINATITVDYGIFGISFQDQIITGNMAKGGDSGSLLVDDVGNAVGLLFAGSSTLTAHNKIANVMNALGISFSYVQPSYLPPRTSVFSFIQLPILAGLASLFLV